MDRLGSMPPKPSAPRRPIWRAWPRSGCRCRRPLCCRSSSARPSSVAIRRPRQKLSDGLREGHRLSRRAPPASSSASRRLPLLVSVRSGAARSMPGMLDTVLDVGCTSAAVHGLMRMSGHPRFAWDCRRRFLESYASVVLGLDPAPFADRLAALVAAEGVGSAQALDSEAIERLAGIYQQMIDDDGRCRVRKIRWNSCRRRRRRSTVPGPASAPAPIAGSRASKTLPVPPSPCRPWCSAIAG